MRWARLARGEGGRRIPANGNPHRKRLGAWPDALKAAGIQRPRAPRPLRPIRVRNPTREEAINSLTNAHADIGEPFTIVRYQIWLKTKTDEHDRDGPPFRYCSPTAITNILGGWRLAVLQAIGEQTVAATAVEQRGHQYTDQEIREAWWACRDTLGRTPRINEYERWRQSRIADSNFTVRPPSEGTIRDRYGSMRWTTACDTLRKQGAPDA